MKNKSINPDTLATLIYHERQKSIGYIQAQYILADLHSQGFSDKEIHAEKIEVKKKLHMFTKGNEKI